MNFIKVKRGRAKGMISRTATFAESVDINTTLSLLEIRLAKLNETWDEFVELQNALYEFSAEADFVDPEPEFEEYEAKFFLAHSILANFIQIKKLSNPPQHSNESVVEKLANQQASLLQNLKSASNISASVKLPNLSIPTFSGDYKDWPEFRDSFMASIDCNSSLSPTQKLQYLKSFLSGKASDLLKHVKNIDSNYLESWDRLESRYDRTHLIVRSFVEYFLLLPTTNSSNVVLLRKITDGADEVIRGLNALQSNDRDPWLIFILIQKLDPETKQAWAELMGSRSDATIYELLEFLQNRCVCLESCFNTTRSVQPRNKAQGSIRSHLVETNYGCPKCNSEHSLFHCKHFLALSVDNRRSFVKEHSLCFNCLRQGHSSNKCRSNNRCKMCNTRHHTLVHLPNSQSNTSSSNISRSNVPSTNTSSSLSSNVLAPTTSSVLSSQLNSPSAANSSISTHICSSFNAVDNSSPKATRFTHTLLPTAIARVKDQQDHFQNVRLLLDSGSQVSFVTEQTVQRLGLIRKAARIPVVGVGSTTAGFTNGVVTFNIFSCHSQQSIEIQCYVISKLTSLIPAKHNSTSIKKILSSYTLADPKFNVPGNIDILVGADKVFSVFDGSAIRGQHGQPDLIPTIFGWVLCGNMAASTLSNNQRIDTYCTQINTSQSFDLERFWRLEEVHHEPTLSIDDQRAENIFENFHCRLPNGRYQVHLPFKTDNKTDFGNTLNVALQRFQHTERKLASSQYLKDKYINFLKEYFDLGHMEEIPESEIQMPTDKCYYLPHHYVLKDDSSTTKVRVVFDGSARCGNKKSLNESLLVGQTYQRDLFSICLRFRRHLYTLSGDIEKMFRQIRVSNCHRDFQRILWRESANQPLKHFRLTTVTYGTACAPFLAIRTLYQLALDSKDRYPRAAEVLLNDFYVDDVMTGADSVDDVISLRLELIELLQSGGFNLRKWTTNCWPLLLSLQEDQRELSPKDFEEHNSVKLLGLQWSPAKDSFSFKVNLNDKFILTKRRILSEASKIFDPIGFLAPVVIAVKILLQELWRKKYSWDDPISLDLANNWYSIRDELPKLETLNIPRIMWASNEKRNFHGFCDASLEAYAAVVYCTSTDPAGNITSKLVAAKTKVAPIKVVSLPRLELCGAVLLTRLIQKLKTSLQCQEIKVFAWTDSSIVLHWLSDVPKRWSVFVSNRTSEILSTIPRDSWYHVRSQENPADCASRGIPPSHLLQNELWWSGPSWIRHDQNQWPYNVNLASDFPSEQLEERKNPPVNVYLSLGYNATIFETLVNKSSTFLNCIRVLAYIRRFVDNSRVSPNAREKQSLTASELSNSKTVLIKWHQSLSFSTEINIISKGEVLKKGNKLSSLNPFLDTDRILRVGGRIQESDAIFATKHPIILDKNTRFAKLIVEHIHKRYLHVGVSQIFAILRQEYFIVGCRNLLRKVVHQCVKCFRHRKTTSTQLMGNLPAERVRYSRPFNIVGVDYAGPITLRLSRGRNPKFIKAYIAVFVCFTTKAIHLELVGELSSAAFIAALDRFASRRGKPSEIWSDNATNFRGSKRHLDELFQHLISQQHNNIISDHLSKDQISWKFIPPSSPHFGGLWEAGVKSVKFHLKRVIGDHKLTYEEMNTLLSQVEALLNSRPMWPTSDMDPIALSPGHFLIGEPLVSVPRPDICIQNVCPYSNWSLLQNLKQGFWKRWHLEYLTSLQQRPKWQTVKEDLKEGDVVVLKEPHLPPSKWILGRIKEIHPGRDNRTRVATITTQTGVYVRPIVKLAPLPFSEGTESFRGG